ncbi:hypothetical protein CMV_028995 [Castanea mollissima]|uniref:Uncharacterized protein n=1 Tax=Castanea mollissima TaxID=60419 RepID=A0A8J4QG66_9ROSI|nr:hypothetical protein CMV_028995 [Castanea mollissima]
MEKSKSFPGHYSKSYSDILSAFDDRSKSYSFNGPSVNNIDDFANSGNPEVKRRKRVAQYNMYTMEVANKIVPVMYLLMGQLKKVKDHNK